ncbi:MAG: HD domain-containing protein [Chloroflexi bacterium]|nr:HD domain-containing protein [Chloroflexota bacterium]
MKKAVPPILLQVRQYLAEENVEGYLVGGYIRDSLLGRTSADLDFAVRGDAAAVARAISAALRGKYLVLDEVNRVYRVVLGRRGPCLDFSSFQRIEEDLARRDFTIDAMALGSEHWQYMVAAENLVDPFGGVADLGASHLRTVSDRVFVEDAVRLLRAVRLAGELGMTISAGTEGLMRRDAALVSGIPGERVRDELVRIFSIPGVARWVKLMERTGVLLAVFPELVPAKGFEQKGVHHWDVLTHSLNTLGAAEFMIRQGPWEYAGEDLLAPVPWTDEITTHFSQRVGKGSTRATMLRIASLFHDVAKPQTKTVEAGGKWHFFGHAPQGARTARSALERTRFSRREAELVELEIVHHLRPWQMAQGGLPTRRAIYRYFRDTGDAGIDIFLLSLADFLATHGPALDLDEWNRQVGLMKYVFEEHRMQARSGDTRIIDGHDMILSLGLKPGPVVGKLLAAVDEARATGEIGSREEALQFARDRMLAMNGAKGEGR